VHRDPGPSPFGPTQVRQPETATPPTKEARGELGPARTRSGAVGQPHRARGRPADVADGDPPRDLLAGDDRRGPRCEALSVAGNADRRTMGLGPDRRAPRGDHGARGADAVWASGAAGWMAGGAETGCRPAGGGDWACGVTGGGPSWRRLVLRRAALGGDGQQRRSR